MLLACAHDAFEYASVNMRAQQSSAGPGPMHIYLNPQPDTRNLMQALDHVP